MTSELETKKTRKPGRKSNEQPTAGKKQFVNHSFDGPTIARFRKWADENAGRVWEFIDRLLETGYQISVKHDSYAECASCFLQTNDPEDPNSRLILTGRSRSSGVAVLAVLYRHFVLFDGEWPNDTNRKVLMDDEV